MTRDQRTRFLISAALAAIMSTASPAVKAETKHHDDPISCKSGAVKQAGLPLHGAIRCVRNPQCRDAVLRRAQRVVQIASELALGGAEAISELVSEMLEDPHQDDVLKRLDRLERMLKDKGLYTAEIERELDLIRTAYE